jgi:capsule polysaccharide export protein KpsE/RkpR
MTPRQETNLELLVGQLQGQLSVMTSSITELKADMKEDLSLVKEHMKNADDWRHQIKDRIERMEAHGKHMSSVAEAFDKLQQSIRDRTMQAKGVIVGVGLAAGAAGATLATFFKSVWAWFTGALV